MTGVSELSNLNNDSQSLENPVTEEATKTAGTTISPLVNNSSDKPCSRQAQLDAPDRSTYRVASQCMVDLGDKSKDQKTLGWGSHGLGYSAIEDGKRKADILKGIEHLELAAGRGNNRSQFLLARVYSDFWGTDVLSPFRKGGFRARAEDFKDFDAAEKYILLLSNNPLVSEKQKRWLEEAAPVMAEWKSSLNAAALAQSQWQSYKDREKTLLEQVLNYSDTGNPDGTETNFWIASEKDKCSLEVIADFTLNASKLNLTELNQTALRIEPIFLEGDAALFRLGKPGWAVRIKADDVMFITKKNLVDLQRLQKAWTLAFEECPGKTSAF